MYRYKIFLYTGKNFNFSIIHSKWKPGVIATNSTSIYQLMRAESISVYLDPKAKTCLPEYPTKWELAKLLAWKNMMHRALQTFSINDQDFQFRMYILYQTIHTLTFLFSC